MRLVCSLIAFVLLLGQARPSLAWKPITHVYLAQQAWEDAKDGKVTLYRVDYETGARGESLGEFKVRRDLLDAITAYPASYFTGVLGPDAYPDIVTGQMRVHPPGRGADGDPDLNANGPGTPPWLAKLWMLAYTRSSSAPVKAFVAGYLAHAAGDVYAHTFINGYTGGIFDLTSTNGLKHTILEGYIEQRTPHLLPINDRRSGNHDPFTAVATLGLRDGVDAFIARNTAEIHCATCDHEDARFMSLPWNFMQIRNWLNNAISTYEDFERELRAPIDDWNEILADAEARLEWSCDLSKHAACPVDGGTRDHCPGLDNRRADILWCTAAAAELGLLTVASAPIELAYAAWRTFTAVTVGPLIHHARVWRQSIDDGLVRWVQTSHRIAMDLFFNSHGMNTGAAMSEIEAFAPIAAAMLVGIDVNIVTHIQGLLRLVTAPIREVKDRIDAVEADLFERAFLALIGVPPEELEEKYLSAQAFVDRLFGAGTVVGVNRRMKLPETADDDFARSQPVTRFDWHTFPAAYNTVTLIKLSLLEPAELNRLYAVLAEKAPRADVPRWRHYDGRIPDNVMLWWGHTIDGSNQWMLGMPLAEHGCVLYRRLFQRVHPGPAMHTRGPAHPAEPDDGCTSGAQPLLTVDSRFAIMRPGATLGLKVSEDAIVEASAGSATACRKNGKLCDVTVTAPHTDVPLDVIVTVRPKVADPRRPPIQMMVQVEPDLAIHVAEPDANAPLSSIIDAGAVLRPGQHVALEVNPFVPVTWTLDGPGRLVAPKRAAKKTVSVDRDLDAKRLALARCKGAAACIVRAKRDIGKAATKLTTLAKTVEADQRAAEQRIYVAPAKVAGGEHVVIRARAADGRTATIDFRLRPALMPLRVKNASPVIKAGQVVTLEVEPPVPMVWTLASGSVGEVGTAERKKLEKEIAPAISRLRTVKVRVPRTTVNIKPLPLTAVPARLPLQPKVKVKVAVPALRVTAKADVDKIVREELAKRPAIGELLRKASTYHAPAKLKRAVSVVVTGVAKDGSGRKLTARIRVVP